MSSQLDVDRMDYLNRDSFYTGVSEGVIGGDRIIKMLEVESDRLVVEEKAIYSIEKFLVARRLMYWQVYLHKTVVSAEVMLVEALKRARNLVMDGQTVFGSPPLLRFLGAPHDRASFRDRAVLTDFLKLDDHDIMGAVKVWAGHADKALSTICSDLVERRTFRIRLQEKPWPSDKQQALREAVATALSIPLEQAAHFVLTDRGGEVVSGLAAVVDVNQPTGSPQEKVPAGSDPYLTGRQCALGGRTAPEKKRSS
ncbi:MAG: hypothetical protein IPI07_11685 [Flavobacteriales bacterium]|nr:hypothetical protein [Flavobacteriales bacterium]